MNETLHPLSHRHNAVICAVLVCACELIAWPVSDEGYLDDFSYAKTALEFSRTGHMVYNHWATAMLGLLIPWGALFIKLFGFSFVLLRLCVMPFVAGTIYIFHRMITHFGISQRNAFIGALTLGLCPLFFPVAVSFMTDVPGMFFTLLSVYMCQLAVASRTARRMLFWLIISACVSLVGGTIRQTSWLGALVAVPATGWYLRSRRGALITGILSAFLGLGGVLACMHWLARQPNVFAEPSLQLSTLHLNMTRVLLVSMVKGILCLSLLVMPLLVGWFYATGSFTREATWRLLALAVAVTAFLIRCSQRGKLNDWLIPWLNLSILQSISGIIDQNDGNAEIFPVWLRLIISLAVIISVAVVTELIHLRWNFPRVAQRIHPSLLTEFLWITGPLTFVYILLVVPRAAQGYLFDRYLLGVFPFAIIALLLIYQKYMADDLPSLSAVVLAVWATYSVAATHDFYASQRASDAAVAELLAAGVPRTAISQSFNSDGWLQVQLDERINMPDAPSPSMSSRPLGDRFSTTSSCSVFFTPFTPAIKARFYVTSMPSACLVSSPYIAAKYLAWLPPFHRQELIEQPVDHAR